jgi:hypothetical protein
MCKHCVWIEGFPPVLMRLARSRLGVRLTGALQSLGLGSPHRYDLADGALSGERKIGLKLIR